jgi:hypothetical protein
MFLEVPCDFTVLTTGAAKPRTKVECVGKRRVPKRSAWVTLALPRSPGRGNAASSAHQGAAALVISTHAEANRHDCGCGSSPCNLLVESKSQER